MAAMAQLSDLEERVARLTAPNTEDGRFSGKKFEVGVSSSLESALGSLRQDLIVVKVSGKLLLDEKEPGEQLTNRQYLVQAMVLLSQFGLNVFLVHGGQEQLDRAIEASSGLDPETKNLAMLKDGAIRYTPSDIMPLVLSVSNGLSDSLKVGIQRAGGNANAYLSSLFVGRQIPDFMDRETGKPYVDPETKRPLPPNSFGYFPLDGRLRVIRDRESRVLRYLRGGIDKPGVAPGHILIRGFLINRADPEEKLGTKRKTNPETGEKEDPYRLNGDADNAAAAHAFYFSSREIVPVMLNGGVQLARPKRVHLIEVARNGGLRSGTDSYDSIVDVVESENDLQKRKIEGGMAGKVKTSLQVARTLARVGVPSIVKIIHVRELLPYLFGNEAAVRSGFGGGYGTTFAPQGLDKLNEQFYQRGP